MNLVSIVLVSIAAVAASFCLVVFFGPPFIPTLSKQKLAALDMLALKPGHTLLELGSGDGRVALAAAERGLRVVAIELNPILVAVSKFRTWRYRQRVRIIWGNIWHTKWPAADAVFTFLLQRQMAKLDKRVAAWHTKPLKVASFAFTIPGKKPVAQRSGIYIYEYK